MLVKLLGKKNLNFKATDGSEICGTSAYIAYPNPEVDGVVAEKLFLHSKLISFDELTVNANILIDFDSRGKVISVNPAPSK